MSEILVKTIYGINTLKGIVDVEIPDYNPKHHLQLEPEEARALALNIIQAAEAAVQEQFLMETFRELRGLNLEESAKLMMIFRNRRAEWNL